ncbi:flagellar hook-length control protein FliK [Profundibacter sp.]
MINLLITDATVSTDSTTTTVGQVVETETMASVEFLAVWNNAPEREPVPRPARSVVDITRAGIMGLFFKRPGGLVPSPELQASPSIISDIPQDGEQVDTDTVLDEDPKQSQNPHKPVKDLPITIIMPDSQMVTKVGAMIDQPVEGAKMIGHPGPVDSYNKNEREVGRASPLGHAIPVQGVSLRDNRIPLGASREAVLSGAKDISYAPEAVMPRISAQTEEPVKNRSLKNKAAQISQVVKELPEQRGNITVSNHHTPPEPDLPDNKKQIIKVPKVGRVPRQDLIQQEAKQNTPSQPDKTALQLPDRPQMAVEAKPPQVSHQTMPIPQEGSKQMLRDQPLPRHLDQPKVSQTGLVKPENSSSVGGGVVNKFTTAVVDSIAAPASEYFPNKVDREAAILTPKETSGEDKSGAIKSVMTPVQAVPVTVSMDDIGVKDTRSFNDNTPFENSDLPVASVHSAGVTPPHHNTAVAQPEIPRHIARQLADVARQMPERPVELTLNPHELGRVRLTFTLTDGGINVAVQAERGDTMDLMRRHIETLAQEFRDMGYTDVGFQFSQHDRENAGGRNPDSQPRHAAGPAPLLEIENPPPARVSLESPNGLDLRL